MDTATTEIIITSSISLEDLSKIVVENINVIKAFLDKVIRLRVDENTV